jgi:hypothetical protein
MFRRARPLQEIIFEQKIGKRILYPALCTTYSAVFSSPSRLRLAIDNGLRLDDGANWRLHRIAGKSADITTLIVAFELGLPYTDQIMTGVTLSGAVNKLEWLHTEQQRALQDNALHCAAASGSVAMVSWLHKHQNLKLDRQTAIHAVKSKKLSVLQ